MPPKRPALVQPRPARTVRRRRLQQRPPHLDGREAPLAEAARGGAAPLEAERPPPSPPAGEPVARPAPEVEAPGEAASAPEVLGEAASGAAPVTEALGEAASTLEALVVRSEPAPTPGEPPSAGVAGEAAASSGPPPGAPELEPELPLLEAEAVVPLSREASVRSAIQAHQAWTEALQAAVAGKAPLDVKAVLADDRCALAAWLAGEGRRFAGPGLAEVALWHRRFHAAAAVVAIRAAAGRPWEAARLLEGPSYLGTSAGLVSALEDLLTTD